ncbi:MAG: hypothetical protein U5J82_05285 [Desulfobacterales bacterium]|nr:hypothetical protein [Desulfobacterales bacterium]
MGDQPGGQTELDQRADHRVSAGPTLPAFSQLARTPDYYYQDDEVTEISEEIAPDVYEFPGGGDRLRPHRGLRHRTGPFRKQVAAPEVGPENLHGEELFDEEYDDSTGFPAVDRFYGARDHSQVGGKK